MPSSVQASKVAMAKLQSASLFISVMAVSPYTGYPQNWPQQSVQTGVPAT